jgi:hypothetical protein
MTPTLKKQYDSKPITQIEKEIRENNAQAHDFKAKMVEALIYLKSSDRYRENLLYRKSNFETYLLGEFNMKLATLNASFKAYNTYPEECKWYGVGLVAKVGRDCGPVRAKKVFKEIEKTSGKLKTPIDRQKINKIIEKHAKPRLAKPPAKTRVEYKQLYEQEREKRKKLQEQYNQAMNELKKAHVQIDQLKETVTKMKNAVQEAA